MIYIGIDTGTHTGIAAWDSRKKKFLLIDTMTIVAAFKTINILSNEYGRENIVIIFEDARKRKWFGANASAKKQGAGSIKRDAVIWQDFCQTEGFIYESKAPARGLTKWTSERFAMVTGWNKRTSEHARDAAMIVFGK